MTTEADKRLPADCRLAAKCLADKDTFQTGQMILTAAADRIEALEAQLAKAEIPQIAVTTEMQERFEAWFVQNYPGPNTIIHNPHWHAPKVFRAALHCVSKDGAEQAIAEAERRGAGEAIGRMKVYQAFVFLREARPAHYEAAIQKAEAILEEALGGKANG